MIFFYNLFLFILFFFSMIVHFSKIKRRGWLFVRSKLGFGLDALQFTKKKRVWFHAVSLGELKLAETLFDKYRNLNYQIFVSTSSDTGFNRAKMHSDIELFYLPLDFSFTMKRVIQIIKPNLVIVVESDVWPQMLFFSKILGARCEFINAKISARSFKRLKLIKSIARWIFKDFDLIITQNKQYYRRFLELGICPTKLKIQRNLKFEVLNSPLKTFEIDHDKREGVIMLSCTHEGEERLILNQIQSLIGKYTIIVAPRHPERFIKVHGLLNQYEVQKTSEDRTFSKNCILVDEMGVLDRYYSISDVVIMGASFVSGLGGHNILEPLRYKKNILFGPFMENQMDLVEYVKDEVSCRQVKLEELYGAVLKVFSKNG